MTLRRHCGLDPLRCGVADNGDALAGEGQASPAAGKCQETLEETRSGIVKPIPV